MINVTTIDPIDDHDLEHEERDDEPHQRHQHAHARHQRVLVHLVPVLTRHARRKYLLCLKNIYIAAVIAGLGLGTDIESSILPSLHD